MPIAKFISLRHLEWSPSEWVTSFFSHTNRSTLCAFQFRLKLYACRLNEVQDWLLCRQACWVFVFIRLSSDLSRQSVNSVCMHAISQLETLVSEEMKLRMRRILDEPMHRISVNIWSLSPTHRNDGGREREGLSPYTHFQARSHNWYFQKCVLYLKRMYCIGIDTRMQRALMLRIFIFLNDFFVFTHTHKQDGTYSFFPAHKMDASGKVTSICVRDTCLKCCVFSCNLIQQQ